MHGPSIIVPSSVGVIAVLVTDMLRGPTQCLNAALSLLLFSVVALTVCQAVQAGTRRHDVADSQFVNLRRKWGRSV